MKPMRKSATLSLFPFVALLIAALSLSGCGGMGAFPDTVVSATPQSSPVGAIQGSVLGGHAPLVGAHVYVLSPGTTGYGGQATSLISSTASGVSTNPSTNGDPFIPSGWQYVTTDSTGSFNITGDYTCTAGNPVYLYSYGGSPNFPSSGTVSISGVSVSGSGSSYTYTFTTTTNQFAYAGQSVTFNQTYGPFTGGTAYSVASVPSNTTFTVTSSTNSSSSLSGLTATFSGANNPDIVELAVLGICPSTGSLKAGGTIFNGTTSSPLNFVYMNEVSTVAAAYAFAPFSANGYDLTSANVATVNNATYISTSTTNLVGIQNAALNAGVLYNVNGSGPLSSSFTGEGHIANATTASGNGYISQATIDTVANILASCVDSNSTSSDAAHYRSGISTQCLTLFYYATSTGVPIADSNPGFQPYDTATAAINIALNPGGPPPSDTTTSSSTWVSQLYNLPTGAVPFTPNLTAQPNDFTVGILYPSSLNNSYPFYAAAPAVDKIGDVWFSSQNSGGTSGYIFQMSPLGVINSSTVYSESFAPGPPTIDSSNQNVWFVGTKTGGPVYAIKSTNTSGNPYTYSSSLTTVGNQTYLTSESGSNVPLFGDSVGNMYDLQQVHSSPASTDPFYLAYYPAGQFNEYATGQIPTTIFEGPNNPILYGAVDGNSAVWLDHFVGSGAANNIISRVLLTTPSGGTPSSGTWPVTGATTNCGNLYNPSGIGITRSQDAIVANNLGNSVMYISATGSCTEYTNSGLGLSATKMTAPTDVAVDGRDYVYVLNNGTTTATSENGSITVLNARGGSSSSLYAQNYTWSPVYYPSGSTTLTSLLYSPTYLALDPSGNIWVTNEGGTFGGSRGNSIVEIIGAAAPTTTPLSRATCTSTVGCIGYQP